MKGNVRQPPPAPAPLSPTAKGTAKYTNKDGSKFITVPKVTTPVGSSQPSPTTMPPASAKSVPQEAPEAGAQGPTQPVNRKKQKRRAKAAAKAAAGQGQSSDHPNGLPSPPASHEQHSAEADADYSGDEEDQYAKGSSRHAPSHENGFAGGTPKSKKAKKKKKKNGAGSNADEPPESHHDHHQHNHDDHHHHHHAHSPQARKVGSIPAPHADHHHHHRPGISREKIWNTSSQEERERIKEFWLGLTESERKSLVKVEKDAVLKKMKEQQKHTCSCTVCGRKRTAIEEELEGLYDAYYEELEQYANHPNQGEGPPLLRPRQSFGSMSGVRPRIPSTYSNHQPSHGRIVEHVGDDEDEDGEEEYSEDELDEDEYSDEEPSEELHRSDYATDFFNFGNSLTVQGGILTVADDLLKNDGKKFIEMMEQLAERRMAREEDAKEQFERGHSHANGDRHFYPQPVEEEFDEEEDEDDEEYDEEYDSQEEEDTMTEEQRMEEGRRMFQIFAARMFEQRVLNAYREKVAKERQAKLLEELEDENRQESQRKAKKAKEAQKRKDKAAKKKEAQAEEKARREAEKAAEEAARLAEEARRAEEQRAKAEEKRKKKEAQKKAEEEERKRKEAERLRRLQEREENERKAREAKEREKKAKEEARLKEKEAREKKEREARERKEQHERDKREKDAKAEARLRAEREAKETREKYKQEERAAQKAAALAAVPMPINLPKRPAAHAVPAAVPALPQQHSTSYASPQIPVATPAFPKVPTPMRVRQASQQESTAPSTGGTSQSGSAPSQNPSPHPITPVHSSPGPVGPPTKSGTNSQSGPLPSPHAASPLSAAAKALPPQSSPYMVPPMGMPFSPGMGQIPPGFGNHLHREPVFPPISNFRAGPGMIPLPPGLNGPVGGRGFPIHPPPGFPGPMDSPIPGLAHVLGPGMAKDGAQSHSRQGSGSFEPSTPGPISQPIARPTPIGRPGSVVHGQRPQNGSPASRLGNPELDTHLGSSALLDDLDDPLEMPSRQSRGPTGLSSSMPRAGAAFPMGPFGIDPMYLPAHANPWGPAGVPQQNLFPPPPPPGFGGHGVNVPWGPSAPLGSTFGMQGVPDRPMTEPRSVQVRKMLRRACEELADEAIRAADSKAEPVDGFIPLRDIVAQVDSFNHGPRVTERELLDMCDTEGNEVNGGGNFDVRSEAPDSLSIRFVSNSGRSNSQPFFRAIGAPGEIGSPVVGSGSFGGHNR
ncbi:salt tolerance down-regulator-domain-containing protein [Apodospora peruviana]|uniref:Stress response protein NST1 n=1 Tax=Apodospora peruviana TaxID=516989 RepID=A0AAE0M550_9PEZI|nr:salt tolerance down-regulator-domain-containing protein [Apodospora peruviana]